MRSTRNSLGGAPGALGPAPELGRRRRPLRGPRAGELPSQTVVLELLMIVGVLAFPLPALVLGLRGLLWRSGRASTDVRADRVELVLLVLARVLALLLLFALSGM